MDDKKAIAVLIKLMNKRSLNAEEKEAVSAAIGILSWSSLAQSRIKNLKAKKIRVLNNS